MSRTDMGQFLQRIEREVNGIQRFHPVVVKTAKFAVGFPWVLEQGPGQKLSFPKVLEQGPGQKLGFLQVLGQGPVPCPESPWVSSFKEWKRRGVVFNASMVHGPWPLYENHGFP